ncbi:MAG: acetate/propionate family kinase [Pseudomonadota bacterium]
MSGILLALNVGSSSLKFQAALAETPDDALLDGAIDRVGSNTATLRLSGRGGESMKETVAADSHAAAVRLASDVIGARLHGERIVGVGHRVVHGGPDMIAPLRVDADLIERLEAIFPLAPLHLPHSVAGILSARAQFPEAIHVACFDTAFHAGKPWEQDVYALPRSYYDQGIRRYGFHGLSCQSVLRRLRADGHPVDDGRLAIAHLGNGCSITAVQNGRSRFCSMGFSTLDGLMMGTRCGHLDPGILLHLLRSGLDISGLERLLYKESGLLGLSGISNDLRDLLKAGTDQARGAIRVFVSRVVEEISRAAGVMGGLDTVVFCGGIGENALVIRERVSAGLAFLPGADGQGVRFLVCETREEQEILLAVSLFLQD